MSNKINPSDPAMPSQILKDSGQHEYTLPMPGLSILADFTKAAMQGMCNDFDKMEGHELTRAETIARRSVRVAIATINELNKEV